MHETQISIRVFEGIFLGKIHRNLLGNADFFNARGNVAFAKNETLAARNLRERAKKFRRGIFRRGNEVFKTRILRGNDRKFFEKIPRGNVRKREKNAVFFDFHVQQNPIFEARNDEFVLFVIRAFYRNFLKLGNALFARNFQRRPLQNLISAVPERVLQNPIFYAKFVDQIFVLARQKKPFSGKDERRNQNQQSQPGKKTNHYFFQHRTGKIFVPESILERKSFSETKLAQVFAKDFHSKIMSKIRSMTGFGKANFAAGTANFFVEITSVNQRGLAISVSTLPEWASAAEKIAFPLVKKIAKRGKINVAFRLEILGAGTPSVAFSFVEKAVKTTLQNLKNSAANLGIDFVPAASTFLRIAEIHRKKSAAVPALESDENLQKIVENARLEALEKFDKMRRDEGEFLKKTLLETLQNLKNLSEKIKKLSAGTTENHKNALLLRLKNLGIEIDFDDERFLKEITIFADKCDISEELARLQSHFEQFAGTLDESEGGRKLDFICQEMLREINTIGSKANNLEITRCVIAAKNEQEKLREQTQNLE